MSKPVEAAGERRKWLMLIPMAVGFAWFFVLQIVALPPRYLLYSPIDDYIPFLPVFIVPYVIWYFYVFATGMFLFRRDTEGFIRFAAFIAGGMIVACTVYAFFPNGQALRPELSGRSGPYISIVRLLYSIDPPVNTSPSIHVTYSLGVHMAISRHCRLNRRPRAVAAASFILAALIILSTVFVKQHSILCIFAGFALTAALCAAIRLMESKKRKRNHKLEITK